MRIRLAVVLLLASAAAYSTAGFFTRLIHVDAWTLLFWRGLFAKPLENRPKRGRDDRLRERTWSVVRARAAALLGRLKIQISDLQHVRRVA